MTYVRPEFSSVQDYFKDNKIIQTYKRNFDNSEACMIIDTFEKHDVIVITTYNVSPKTGLLEEKYTCYFSGPEVIFDGT